MTRRRSTLLLLCAAVVLTSCAPGGDTAPVRTPAPTTGTDTSTDTTATACPPTVTDAWGPYYRAGAPVRDRVGDGELVIAGTVRSWPSCRPVAGATVEFWQVAPSGAYTDDYRATVVTAADGTFRFETGFPVVYETRPPHVHVRVSGVELHELVTQLYPEAGTASMNVELVAVQQGVNPPAGYELDPPSSPRR